PALPAALVRGDRVLHLHRLEDDDEIARGDRVAVRHRDLDDRALHGRGDRVARYGGGALAATALARRGLGRGGRARAAADGEVARQRHLQPAPAHLDDDGLALGLLLLGALAAGERLDRVVPLGLDP